MAIYTGAHLDCRVRAITHRTASARPLRVAAHFPASPRDLNPVENQRASSTEKARGARCARVAPRDRAMPRVHHGSDGVAMVARRLARNFADARSVYAEATVAAVAAPADRPRERSCVSRDASRDGPPGGRTQISLRRRRVNLARPRMRATERFMAPTAFRNESIDAPYRIKLALDRTMLAWVRTSISMASFGFAMVAFFRTLRMMAPTAQAARVHEGAIRFGTALLALAIVAIIGAALGHRRALRTLERGQTLTLGHWPLSITLGMLVAAAGLVGFWLLFHR
jgi:putative membrane protein